jgi:hypothetical protein
MNIVKTVKLNINQTQIVYILCLAIVATVFSYIYSVNSMAFNAAKHQSLIEQVSITQSEVSDLEAIFIEKDKEITQELAVQMNLTKEIEKDTIFVLRGENTRLTFNDEQ